MKTTFQPGQTAIITGGASGIGFALAKALAQRGIRLWLADINEPGLDRAVAALGSKAVACPLDVRDGEAFEALVERVVAETGRLDFLFNNAGVGMAGEAHELGRVHFDRTIDINIRGVTNGIVAAYPVMVRQGSGHIANTASLAGLVPTPLFVPYGMSKHAVVGLTRSLRFEAARYGVGISAICPSAIETPLLDAVAPEGLPVPPWLPDPRRFLARAVTAPFPADRLAEEVLRGIEKNRELIIVPRMARLTALAYRWFPGLAGIKVRAVLDAELAQRQK